MIDELHWKVARFLTDNFDVILLPTFDTQQMVVKTARKLRKKSVRSLLSFSHYKFGQRLELKCIERGKKLIRVCEAYTSKTVSWNGKLLNIGSAKTITSDGITVNRDINGARGIFLRALVDSPILIEGAR
ncbi:zinc ribbon domain-containing protein [Allochromatium warmingii]|uniref:zinc ribbon domain-containing protein n=1 Tax=Allochromatium warmingii TaxID=61595 RepID=UPI00116044F9|nr:zinc ribbon domain-containing protein [Allochromatium warmingii]